MLRICDNVGERFVAGNVILINQKAAEAWVSGGTVPLVWQMVRQEIPTHEMARQLRVACGLSEEDTQRSLDNVVRALWLRRLITVDGRCATDSEVCAAHLPEAHNKSGYLPTVAVATEKIYRCTFDLLVPCNLRCRHCYLDFSRKDIMPIATVNDYLSQLEALGCVEISLTGGEIFLRRDLMHVLDAALCRGFLVDLLTNGTFIDEGAADAIARRCVSEVQISIYGSTAALHEAVTKAPGSFQKSVNAVRRLVERGVRVRIANMVQRDNFDDAFRFKAFAESLGARAQFETKLVPTRDGRITPLDFGIGVEQLATLYRKGVIKREVNYLCSAAVSKLRITAHGEVYPCEIINNTSMGNLHNATLQEIWNSHSRRELRAQILGFKPQRCGGCSQASDCEPCAAIRGFGYEQADTAEISEACLITTAGVIANSGDNDYRSRSMDQLRAIVHGPDRTPTRIRTSFESSLVQIMSVRVGQ